MGEVIEQPQRRHRRVRADLAVHVSTIEPDVDPRSGKPYFRASWERCENISRGGAFIQTHDLLDPGRRVLLEVSLPDGGRLEALGRVAWTRRRLTGGDAPGCGLGVEFLGGDAGLMEWVERLEDQVSDS